jgi:hypothetical protein
MIGLVHLINLSALTETETAIYARLYIVYCFTSWQLRELKLRH